MISFRSYPCDSSRIDKSAVCNSQKPGSSLGDLQCSLVRISYSFATDLPSGEINLTHRYRNANTYAHLSYWLCMFRVQDFGCRASNRISIFFLRDSSAIQSYVRRRYPCIRIMFLLSRGVFRLYLLPPSLRGRSESGSLKKFQSDYIYPGQLRLTARYRTVVRHFPNNLWPRCPFPYTNVVCQVLLILYALVCTPAKVPVPL